MDLSKNKPKILIIGHARHGKDTVAKMISETMGLKFESSSEFVGKNCIWNAWGKERYSSFEEMFEDRVNYRKTWANLIETYNTPDASRTATDMIESGCDMYVGMRRQRELQACINKKLFDFIIWVDATKRLPLEDYSSNEMTSRDANFWIDNNKTEEHLRQEVIRLKDFLHIRGFKTNSVLESNTPTWFDKPKGATTILDYGFIKVLEVMGEDKSIANAARMSYGRGTKKVNTNQGLINYLVRNHHTSPLEMGEIQFHIRLPIFVMRQLVRHRTANLNEYSGRYSEMVRLFYIPQPEQIKTQDKINKQGSDTQLTESENLSARLIIESTSNNCFDQYENLLELGISRETARIVLPLNTYTECVWKLDISNLIKFLFLRDDSHAQWEIQVYAKEISKAVEKYFPQVYKAYMSQKNLLTLSELQVECLIQGKILEGLSKSETKQVEDILDKYHGYRGI